MDIGPIAGLIVFGLMVAALIKVRRQRGRAFNRPGPGAAGSVYDMLNQDKRHAIELIVEERAEARDPETADDTLKGL